jgi:hypothetical protein
MATMTATKEEVRLRVQDLIMEILVALAVEDDTTDEEVSVLETDMTEVATLIVESLGLEILTVDNEDGTKFTASCEILESELTDED